MGLRPFRDLLPPLKRGAFLFGEGPHLLQGLKFGAAHPYGPIGARAGPSRSPRGSPRSGGVHVSPIEMGGFYSSPIPPLFVN